MDPSEEKKKRLEAYLRTVEALERVQFQELSRMTEEEARRKINSLGVVGKPWRERPDWSGLVEQQALFHRKKKS